MPPFHLLLLIFLLGCATGALFMALLRRRAIERVRHEFEQELHRQMKEMQVTEIRRQPSPDPRARTYDA